MNFFFWALTLFNFQGSSSARSLSELVYYTSPRTVCQHFFSTFFSFFRAALFTLLPLVRFPPCNVCYITTFSSSCQLLSFTFSIFFLFFDICIKIIDTNICQIYNESVQNLHEKNKRGACFKQAEIKRVSALTLGPCARNLIWIMPT